MRVFGQDDWDDRQMDECNVFEAADEGESRRSRAGRSRLELRDGVGSGGTDTCALPGTPGTLSRHVTATRLLALSS
jgi:hypothetical protein